MTAEQQAAPGHADLHQRLAEVLAARVNGVASDGRGWFRTAGERERFLGEAVAVLAALGPELAELAALREQHAATQAENERLAAELETARKHAELYGRKLVAALDAAARPSA